MYVIPVQIGVDDFSIFVILADENIERIKRYDPAEVTSNKFGEPWSKLRLRDVVIMYATAAELAQVQQMFATGMVSEALTMLARGFAYKPKEGDHDEPYTRSQ